MLFFRYKDARKLRDLSVFNITQLLPFRKGDNLFVRAKLVQDTLKTFFSSADSAICQEHAPMFRTDDNGGKVFIEEEKRQVSGEQASALLPLRGIG